MRKLFLAFLLFPLAALAQKDKYDFLIDAFFKDSSGKMISLPEIERWDRYRLIDSIASATAGFRILTDSGYHKIFGDKSESALPIIDFNKYFLSARSECIFCAAVCNHAPGNHSSCHRQACEYALRWFLFEKEKPPIECIPIPETEIATHNSASH